MKRNEALKKLLEIEYDFASKELKKKAAALLEKLKSAENVLLLSHPTPDEDAYGSLFSLFDFCSNQLDIPTEIGFYEEPENHSWMVNDANCVIPENGNFGSYFTKNPNTLCLIVDIGDISRIAEYLPGNICSQIVLIDHHKSRGECIGDFKPSLELNSIQFESTTELILWLFEQWGYSIDAKMATMILYGLWGDTEYYQDPYLLPRINLTVAWLKYMGADEAEIINQTVRNQNPEEMKINAQLLEGLQVEKHFAYVIIPHSIYDELMTELPKSKSFNKGELAAQIRKISGIDFAFVLAEEKPGFVSCSLRARNNNVDLRIIAEKFGGGGHPLSAAFRVHESLDSTKSNLLDLCNSLYPV